MILTQEQLNDAARAMARGTSRKALLDRYYEQLKDSPDIGLRGQELRDKLSDELGHAHIGNARFAVTKYQDIYDIERGLMREAYAETYAEARDLLLDTLKKDIASMQKDVNRIDTAIEDYVPDATNPGEYATLLSLKLKASKELRDAIQELGRITGTLQHQPDALKEIY